MPPNNGYCPQAPKNPKYNEYPAVLKFGGMLFGVSGLLLLLLLLLLVLKFTAI